MSEIKNQEALSQALNYSIGAEQAAVLPSLANPKLVVPLCGLSSRWRLSAFYPAFRLRAKPWRMMQRCRSLLGLAPTINIAHNIEFREFISDVFPDITHTSVLLGTPGPNRKVIVQLWQASHLVGYFKVASTESASDKIRAEATILETLPKGLGPTLLKSGLLDKRLAMILSPVEGGMLPAVLPALESEVNGRMSELMEYLAKLNVSDASFTIDDHPAIIRLREQLPIAGIQCSSFDDWLTPLRTRSWAIVLMHGDFAPWNVFRQPDGSLCAIDWEEGFVDGFPYFDLIHFINQTAALALKWTPSKCADYILKCLGAPDDQQKKSVAMLGLLASYCAIRRSITGHHWILDWKLECLEALK